MNSSINHFWNLEEEAVTDAMQKLFSGLLHMFSSTCHHIKPRITEMVVLHSPNHHVLGPLPQFINEENAFWMDLMELFLHLSSFLIDTQN